MGKNDDINDDITMIYGDLSRSKHDTVLILCFFWDSPGIYIYTYISMINGVHLVDRSRTAG